MDTVLIYDAGMEYEPSIEVKEFDTKEEMLKFINELRVGDKVIAAYEYFKKIEIEPYEKVTSYKFK